MLLLLAFTSLMACSHSQDNNDNPAYAPVVNPHPQYFMTVQGHIGDQFENAVNLFFEISYGTNNLNCYKTVNKLEGAKAPRSRKLIYKVIGDKFYHQFPIDYFFQGACLWKANSLTYYLYNKSKNNLLATNTIFFSDHVTSKKESFDQILCAKTLNSPLDMTCKYGGSLLPASQAAYFQDYILKINIKATHD